MTLPVDPAPTAPTLPPWPLRVAAVLCLVSGVLSLLGAVAVSLPLAAGTGGSWLPLALNLIAPLGVLAAAGLLWRGRKLGALVLALAWAAPTMAAVVAGRAPQGPSLVLVLILVVLAANWRLLR